MLKPLNGPPPITLEVLHSDLPVVIVAAVILAAGVASFILWSLKSRDPLLLGLAIFASLYGIRIFMTNPLIVLATGLGGPGIRHAAEIITYGLPIPLILFLRELIGPGWRNSLVIWLWVQIVFAAVAVAGGVLSGDIYFADTASSFLIIVGSSLLLVHLFFFYRAESGGAVVKAGFTVFVASVLFRNFRFAGGPIVEPIALMLLVCALGYAAALRAISREKTLISVEQELATARRIQASILPKSVPDMSGLQIATRYVPMTSVAGDFYDFLILDAQRLTIFIADVSGHGVPAALIASMLKVGVAAQRHNAGDPAAILAGLNAMLRGVLDGQFVTAACAFIDLTAHTLTYSAAGHPPALLARQGQSEIMELAENGLFLGPFPQASYSNLTVPFRSGDKLLLYTDGIIEATLGNGQPFGDEGLKQFMLQHRDSDRSVFADRLIRAISGASQEDDLTLVIAEATPVL